MKIYKYRFCKLSEIDKLKEFIDKHWRKGHVLSKSDELIKFQHLVDGSDHLTFVVAENLQTGEFDGVYGYISNWKYAPSHHIPNVQWGANWKTRDDVHNEEIGKIGFGMLRYILKNDPAEVFGSLGISGIHKQLAETLGYIMGDMNRYYIPNQSFVDFKVIKHPDMTNMYSEVTDSCVKEIDFPNGVTFEHNMNPYKDIEYFENRYKNHISFKYRYLGVYKRNELKGVFVFRNVDSAGPRVLRIMDFIGDITDVNNVNASVQQLLKSENAEYIDCLNHGIEPECFHKLGFKEAKNGGDTILPEYFDPFEQRYVPMEFCYLADKDIDYVIFKGDGDQDRPNS